MYPKLQQTKMFVTKMHYITSFSFNNTTSVKGLVIWAGLAVVILFYWGHTLITLALEGTQLVSKSEQNANLVNKPYLVNMLTRVLSWSKKDKNVLT